MINREGQLNTIIDSWCNYVSTKENITNKDNKLFDIDYISKERKCNLVDLANEIRDYILESKELANSSYWLSLTETMFLDDYNAKEIDMFSNLLTSDNYTIVDTLQNISDMVSDTCHTEHVSIKDKIKHTSITNVIEDIKNNYKNNTSFFLDLVFCQD